MVLFFNDRQALEQAHKLFTAAQAHPTVDVSYFSGDTTVVYGSGEKALQKDHRIEFVINAKENLYVKFSRRESFNSPYYFLDVEVIDNGKKHVFDGSTTASDEIEGMNLALISLLTNIEDFAGKPFPSEMWDHYDNFIKSRRAL